MPEDVLAHVQKAGGCGEALEAAQGDFAALVDEAAACAERRERARDRDLEDASARFCGEEFAHGVLERGADSEDVVADGGLEHLEELV